MTQRFEQREDCYYDTETGLEWSLENYGPMSWEQAVEFCKKLYGWKLPTIQMLLTLVDHRRFNPATALPDMVPSDYWSSTTYAFNTGLAWLVDFRNGYDDWRHKSNGYYVRAVRGALRYQV